MVKMGRRKETPKGNKILYQNERNVKLLLGKMLKEQ
jgi:hypothetical protein